MMPTRKHEAIHWLVVKKTSVAATAHGTQSIDRCGATRHFERAVRASVRRRAALVACRLHRRSTWIEAVFRTTHQVSCAGDSAR